MKIAAARPSRFSACDCPLPASRRASPPGGRGWHMASRRLASALPWRSFPDVHHQLRHPRPTADVAVPSSPPHAAEIYYAPPHPPIGRYLVVYGHEKACQTGRAGGLGAGSVQNLFFRSPMYMAFPTTSNRADRMAGPLSPLPCHGYGVSSAHHREVRGRRRACERTPRPLSGAAAAPPRAGVCHA
jgi:hypothetical protein